MKRQIKYYFFFFVIAGVVSCVSIVRMRPVEVCVTSPEGLIFKISMPEADRKILERFFLYLIVEDGFGYTLLGNKPVSLSSYRSWRSYSNLTDLYSIFTPDNMKIRKGWKIWGKYKHYFQNYHYSFWVEQSPWIKNGMIIVLANKEHLSHVVQMYSLDFQKVLNTTDLTRFLDNEKSRPLFKVGLKGHEGLIGTVLGYGRGNAWLFFEKQQGKEVKLDFLWEKNLTTLSYKTMIREIFSPSRKKDLSSHLSYPIFAANLGSKETNCLKKEYHASRKVILDYYDGKDFLEATLSLLKYGK